MHAGADDEAEAGVAQEQEQQHNDRDRDRDDDQPPGRVIADADIHGYERPGWRRIGLGAAAEDPAEDLLYDQSQSEGDENLAGYRSPVDELDQPPLQAEAAPEQEQGHQNKRT